MTALLEFVFLGCLRLGFQQSFFVSSSPEYVVELVSIKSDTNLNLWKLNYEYGELNANGTVDAVKNTGNLAKQTISFDGAANPFVQTYKYDALYRLTEAEEKTNSSQNWKQTYGYDVYGNRTAFSQIVGSTNLSINSETLPSIDVNTNRFNASQGYTYDKAGNLAQDTENRTFVFNGDNKQVEVKDASNNVIGTYFYDGDGKRVKKVTADETTVFVYSGGKLAAEFSTKLAPAASTKYVATDTLGSIRAISDQSGNIVSRRDFMPFGEEMYAGTPNRDASQKYSTDGDDVRQKFTGYERDKETGLDFAEARYYKNNHGRFTAVDPLLASGKSASPQTFNRYAYVSNSPLLFTDPSGMQQAETVNTIYSKARQKVVDWITYWFDTNGSSPYSPSTYNPSDTEDRQARVRSVYGAISSSDPLQNANFQRFLRMTEFHRDEGTRRVVGNKGMSLDNLLQQTTESYEAARKIGEANLAFQQIYLLAIPSIGAMSSTSTSTTNMGFAVPRGSGTGGFSLYARRDAMIRAEVARDNWLLANPSARPGAIVGVADTQSTLSAAIPSGYPPPRVFGQRMFNSASRLGVPGAQTPSGNRIGCCTEFKGANELELRGANPANLVFTTPIRPRNGNYLGVCSNCQTMFSPRQFFPGTRFDK